MSIRFKNWSGLNPQEKRDLRKKKREWKKHIKENTSTVKTYFINERGE